MKNPVATRSRLQRVTVSPRRHPSLTGAAATPAKPGLPKLGLLPVTLMVLAGLYAASAAQFTTQAWPLIVLLALPVAALVFAWFAKPSRPAPVPRRKAKDLVDRRPVLLRPMLILPPGRPPRITGRVAPQMRLLSNHKPNRPAKIIQTRWIMPRPH